VNRAGGEQTTSPCAKNFVVALGHWGDVLTCYARQGGADDQRTRGTPSSDLHRLYGRAHEQLETRGIEIGKSHVGEYCTPHSIWLVARWRPSASTTSLSPCRGSRRGGSPDLLATGTIAWQSRPATSGLWSPLSFGVQARRVGAGGLSCTDTNSEQERNGGRFATKLSPDHSRRNPRARPYRVLTLSDCLAATSVEEHYNALAYDFPTFSRPMTSSEFIAELD